MSGLGRPLPVTSGAIPDLPVPGVTPPDDVGVGEGPDDVGVGEGPDDVGVGEGVGSPEGVVFPGEAGGVDWPPPSEAGGLDDPLGDPDPTLGLGEALGARFGACDFVGCADGVAEDGTSSGAGGEVGTFDAPLELAAAGDVVGGIGPLMHGDVELVVDDVVVWVLAGLPELPPL